MDSAIKLKAQILSIKYQIRALKQVLTKDQLKTYETKINECKQEFVAKYGISQDCQEDQEFLDKHFF